MNATQTPYFQAALYGLLALAPACAGAGVGSDDADAGTGPGDPGNPFPNCFQNCTETNSSTTVATTMETSATDTDTETDTETGNDSTSTTIATDSDSTTTGEPDCGNGKLDPGEDCDFGHDMTCPADCLHDCGDGFVHGDPENGGEECDDGDDNGDDASCTSECKEAICGDGLVLADEEKCDDGAGNGDDASCTSECKEAICGDGLVLAAGDKPEQCDDGNLVDDDGCSSTCTIEHRLVFVTSTGFQGDLAPQLDNLTGLPLADAHCQELAAAVKVEPGTFMAWLSDGKDGPSTRFGLAGPGFTGVFELATGTPIADGWADLTDGTLEVPIDVNEKGTEGQAYSVWTNTDTAGARGDKHCQGWTSKSPQSQGRVGTSGSGDNTWTTLESGNCGNTNRLYCFQVSSKNP